MKAMLWRTLQRAGVGFSPSSGRRTEVSRCTLARAPQANERGFALLLIFVLAASVAIMLYTQMPRVAFESERDKEQLLIDRGEQYKRAIQLFYADNRRFPARIEDLENTNNHRYLRRRYIDPYTGKDEWRLIHTNGMYLTDSLVQKPPANPANQSGGQNQTLALTGAPGTPNPLQNGSSSTPSPTSSANSPQNGGTSGAPQPVNAAVLARPSDRPITPNNGVFPGAGAPLANVNNGYVDPASYPPITLFPNGYNAPTQQNGFQGGMQANGQIQPGGQFQPIGQPGFQQGTPFQGGQVQPGQFAQGQFQPGFPQPGQLQPGQFQNGQFQNGVQTQALPFNQPPTPDPNANLNGQTGAQSPFPNTSQSPITLPSGQTIVPTPGLNQNFANQFPQNQFPQQGPNPILPNPVTPTPFDPNGGQVQNPVQQQPAFPVPTPPPNAINQFPNNQPPGMNAPAGMPVPNNQAVNMINQLLTTPRPPPPGVGGSTGGGISGATTGAFGTAVAGNATVGAGIAGVASTYEGPTIKTYADKAKFQEWEFIFQLQQQQGVPGAGLNPLQNGGQNPNNGTNPNGTPNPNGTGTNPQGGGQNLFTPPNMTPIQGGTQPQQ